MNKRLKQLLIEAIEWSDYMNSGQERKLSGAAKAYMRLKRNAKKGYTPKPFMDKVAAKKEYGKVIDSIRRIGQAKSAIPKSKKREEHRRVAK